MSAQYFAPLFLNIGHLPILDTVFQAKCPAIYFAFRLSDTRFVDCTATVENICLDCLLFPVFPFFLSDCFSLKNRTDFLSFPCFFFSLLFFLCFPQPFLLLRASRSLLRHPLLLSASFSFPHAFLRGRRLPSFPLSALPTFFLPPHA